MVVAFQLFIKGTMDSYRFIRFCWLNAIGNVIKVRNMTVVATIVIPQGIVMGSWIKFMASVIIPTGVVENDFLFILMIFNIQMQFFKNTLRNSQWCIDLP